MLRYLSDFKASIERNKTLLPMVYRYKRFKRMRRIVQAEKNEFPETLTLETTNLCNIACIKCPRADLTRPLGFMDFDFFKKVIDESLQYGKRSHIGMVMLGEATMHPRLVDMVSYMSEKGATEDITLNTNALLLDEKMSEELIRAGLDSIRFSIDASTAETYNLLMQRNRFERFVDNIQGFLDVKKRLGYTAPKTIIRVTLSDENKDELEEIRLRWENQADEFEIVPAMNWAGSISLKSPHPMPYIDRAAMGPCTELWHTMYIYQNGEVALCCVDWDNEFGLGDLKKNSIHAVWNNDSYKRVRTLHKEGNYEELPYCAGCDMRAIR
jgi:radical SAM protein with 4Fe4S-binding SPASM domain